MCRRSLVSILFLFLISTDIAMSQGSNSHSVGDTAAGTKPGYDDEYLSLSKAYTIIRKPLVPSDIPQSVQFATFLQLFPSNYVAAFSVFDAKLIDEHRESWFEKEELAILNESNARAYEAFSHFYQMDYEKLAAGEIKGYVAAFQKVESDHEARLVEHHRKLLSKISPEGSRLLLEILGNNVIPHIIATSWDSKFDIAAFTAAYPEVMARQLIIDAAQIKGPPPELVIRTIKTGPLMMTGTFPKER